ncbi:OmpA family protein [Nitrosomonas sp.]|uniref:OmpA family protein n=1 Tax=Nitrosomonas sp. TaxID=42353 RepID=UPI003305E9BC
MYKTRVISILLTGFVISGCADMSGTQKGTGTGALLGAGTGAAIGALAGGGKGAAIGAGAGAALGAGAGYLWSKKMEEQKVQMENATAGTGVVVSKTPDNQLMLNIPSDISFDTGSAQIKPNFRPILDSFATSLLSNSGTQVTIVGHTDNTGSDAVNNPLSVNRAASTREYLASRGVPFQRIQIDGRGSYQPVASNDSATGRAKNRRVEIYVSETRNEVTQ